MAANAIILFASALFVETISGQCIGAMNNIAGASALAAEGLALAGNAMAYGPNIAGGPFVNPGGPANYGLAANSFIPSSGGGFAVTSSSPITPTGISVVSENAIEGSLAVNGELPFLGAVAVEGFLPTAGAGGISYGCGNDVVGIVSEGVAPAAGPYGPMGSAAGVVPGRFGYGPGSVGPGIVGMGAPGLGAGFGAPGLAYNSLAGGYGAFGGVY